jgi:hypothetical protein
MCFHSPFIILHNFANLLIRFSNQMKETQLHWLNDMTRSKWIDFSFMFKTRDTSPARVLHNEIPAKSHMRWCGQPKRLINKWKIKWNRKSRSPWNKNSIRQRDQSVSCPGSSPDGNTGSTRCNDEQMQWLHETCCCSLTPA